MRCQLHLFTDNTTLCWSLKRWGSKSIPLNTLVQEIWEVCQRREIHLVPHWVPSAENPADRPSRVGISPYYHSSLHPEFMAFVRLWFLNPTNSGLQAPYTPLVDWMAESGNTQCSQFVGEKENFFLQDLALLSPGWLNPPPGH